MVGHRREGEGKQDSRDLELECRIRKHTHFFTILTPYVYEGNTLCV